MIHLLDMEYSHRSTIHGLVELKLFDLAPVPCIAALLKDSIQRDDSCLLISCLEPMPEASFINVLHDHLHTISGGACLKQRTNAWNAGNIECRRIKLNDNTNGSETLTLKIHVA